MQVTTSLAVASSGAVDYGSVQAEGKDNDCVVMASAGDGEDDEDPADYQDMNMVDLIFDGKTAVAKHRLENGLYTKEDLVATRSDMSLLSVAALYGYNEIVELVLQRTNFRLLEDYASMPLVNAVVRNQKRVVQTLLTTIGHEVDVSTLFTQCGEPLVYIAASGPANEILETLLSAGSPVDAASKNGETALHAAAGTSARGVEILLRANANVNAVDHVGLGGRTPLHKLAYNCVMQDAVVAIMERLFIAEAALDTTDNEGKTPADITADEECRARLVAEATFRASFPVHCIARNGHVAKFRDLLPKFDGPAMRWEGRYCDDGGWKPVVWAVNAVAVPHEACYRFVGCDVDDAGPFTLCGKWSGGSIEVTTWRDLVFEYNGTLDVHTGVWSGDRTTYGVSNLFHMTLPLHPCPTCKESKVLRRDEPCLGCLPADCNMGITEDTIEARRLHMEETYQSIATDIKKQDDCGRTALMHAAKHGHSTMLAELLPFCSAWDLEATDNDGMTALDHAMSRKLMCQSNVEHKDNEATLKCIEMLVKAGRTDVDARRIPTALAYTRGESKCSGDCVKTLNDINLPALAASHEWTRIAELLSTPLPSKTLNKCNEYGKSLLQIALENGKTNILRLLLTQPLTDVKHPFLNEQYPLYLAASQGNLKCVRMLLNAGANPLELVTPSSLDHVNRHGALLKNFAPRVQDVLQAKIDLKQQYPLYYLARVEDCAQAAAYVQAQQSPIHVAITTQLPISVLSELIYESPQEVNAQDKLGNTPLMVASKLGLLDHVHMLLDNEADVDMTNHHGQSALMMAAMGGHIAIVDSLLKHLADVALRDANDKTVLDMLQSHITTHLAGRSCHERTKSPFVQIQDAVEKEIRDSKTSTEYRAKLAASLADLTAKTAFDRNGFAKAINCAPELGVTFLNDCVTMDRHDVHFTNLDYVYGKHVSASALHALLHMETDDPDLIFEAKTKCFEHVTIRRILEIKWELFGQRKFLEMLFMYLVLLVSMTISAVLFHDDDTRLDAASVEVLLGVLVVSLAIVGCIAVQALRPQTLWRLARYRYDGSLAFDPELDIPDLWRHKASAKRWLKLGVLIGTLLLAGLLVGLLVVTSSISFFPVFNNVVLAVAAVYFVVNEYQEARGDLSAYLASTINVVQVSMYMLILVVFLPMQLNWLDTPDQVEIAVGSGITLTLWILSLQFLEVERNASYLLPMLTGLLKDLWNFFLFFGVFQIGITVTFFQLYKTTDSDDFNSLSGSFLTSYFVAFGQVPMGAMGAFTDEKTKSIDGYDWILYIFAVGMIMAHSAVVVLFLLNLLVANMNKTVDGGLEKAKTEALAAYAQCILRLEEAMHCSPKETQDLIYFIPPTPSCDGKLNPIFTASMPKSHYGITAEIEAAIATHVAQQTSWVTMAKTIQDQVTAALTMFEDGLLDVAHFVDVDISVVFAKELVAVAVTRSSLDKVFVSMRKSRGQQDQRKLLGRFRKAVARELMTLGRTLHQIGAVASDDDHARCVIVYKLARQSSMASDIEALQAHASSSFDEAMGAIGDVVCDADGKDSSRALLAEMQALMEAQAAQAAAVIAAMEEKNAAAMATMAAMEGQIEALLHTVETLVVVSAVA